jgi:PKD repeat protein
MKNYLLLIYLAVHCFVNPLTAQQITGAEYFFDHDPGVGQGIALPVTASDSVVILSDISTIGLSGGLHRFYVRARNQDGQWSSISEQWIIVSGNIDGQKIVAAEYFIDTDPGLGLATAISVAPQADSVCLLLPNFQQPFDTGVHTIYVRVKNLAGMWSVIASKTYRACDEFGGESAFFYQVVGRKATFDNFSPYYDTFQWDFGDGTTETTQVSPVHEYQFGGVYKVSLISANACGSDTLKIPVYVSGLQSIYPNRFGQSGLFTADIRGVNICDSCAVFLTNGTNTIQADTATFFANTNANAYWKFNDAPIGTYHLVMELASGVIDTLKNAIKIEPTIQSQLQLQIIGRNNRVRIGQENIYTIEASTSGNTPLYGASVRIMVRVDNPNSMMEVKLVDTLSNYGLNDISDPLVRDSLLQLAQQFLSYHDSAFTYHYLLVTFPLVRPGEPVRLNFTIKAQSSSDQFDIYTIGNGILNTDTLGGKGLAVLDYLCGPCLQTMVNYLSLIPGPAGCAAGIASSACTIYNESQDNKPWYKKVINVGISVLSTALGCASFGVSGLATHMAKGATVKMAGDVGVAGIAWNSGFAGIDPCIDQIIENWEDIQAVFSLDPNVKFANEGKTPENYIGSDETLNYSIYYENADSALSPAALVIVKDQLDTSVFDLNTFEFVGYGWGDSLFLHDGQRRDSLIIDHDLRPSKNFILRHKAYYDRKTGKVEWCFVSLDPVTYDLTGDPFDGFLPPNVTKPEGEGFVRFRIKPKQNLPNGTPLRNKAAIFFDFNPPIPTPEWVNTIDRIKPESQVASLSAMQHDTTILLHLSGADQGAGIDFYEVFMSENDSTFRFLGRTIADTVSFKGKYQHKYAFFSQATDLADNIEDTNHIADAYTMIVSTHELQRLDLKVFPNPTTGKLYLMLPENMQPESILIADVMGKTVINRGKIQVNLVEIDFAFLPDGVYFVRIVDEKRGSIGVAKVVVKRE